jgi:ribonuclease E
MNGSAVEQMDGGHMPIERPPYESQPAMTSETLVPPPPPIAPVFTPTVAPPSEPVFAQAPQPAPAEPPPPPVVPTISVDTPPEKPKRGWWRR